MSRGYSSNWETVGSTADPDILYYNASIVNNNTDDLINGFAFADPLIRFNETRDKAIIPDASKYQFSIVRFVLNGGNLDLPLFIPAIQSFTNQTDPNLTEYGVGIALSVSLTNVDTTTTTYNICPNLTYLIFTPENLNPLLAPVPLPPSSPDYVGVHVPSQPYAKGNIVNSLLGGSIFFQATVNVPAGTPLNGTYTTPTGAPMPYWTSASPELGRPQDVSTRYYWVNSYQTVVNMMNTALQTASNELYASLVRAWTVYGNGNDATNLPAPFTSLATFTAAYPAPVMSYDIPSGLFSIAYPDVYLNPSPTKISLWFNSNTYGLFANFLSTYYNTAIGDGSLGPVSVPPPGPFLPGYAYHMNVQYLGLGTNTIEATAIYPPVTYTGRFIKMTQEYASTSTLWSPIDSIVFISNLLPIQNEQTAPPNAYGNGNVGNSTAVSKSAFQPIITDIANSLSGDPTGYRKMIYYAPTAEYRMADFQNSKAEIKNIDIQLFWKNRLNNQLYPVSMYNLSSVSFKMMFRKKNALMGLAKSERTGY